MIEPRLDRRAAMKFVEAGLHSVQPVGIDAMATIDTRFPGFVRTIGSLSGS